MVLSRGENNKGEPSEPVAVETCLGWVLSGPLKGVCDDSHVSVNLMGHNVLRNVDCRELEDSSRKLWDYETLGIRDDEVHEALKDAIFYNGKRYQVSLP